jgi:uncharacterized protein
MKPKRISQWAILASFFALVLISCRDGDSSASKDSGTNVTESTVVPRPVRTREEWEARSEKGEVDAMVELARILVEDSRLKSNATQAVVWAEKAADLGSADAEWLLSELYEAGRGVQSSSEKSFQHALIAAKGGHPQAQYEVGLKYATGRGVTKDKAASVTWFGMSATQGVTIAQFNLAQRFEHGEGTLSNRVMALGFYRLAAEGKDGIADAARSAARLESELSASDREAAQEWLRGFQSLAKTRPK